MKILPLFRNRPPQPPRSPLDWISIVWKDTADVLLLLTRWQIVAYCVVVCRRFHPAYEQFCARIGIGYPEVLAGIRELLMQYLREDSFSASDHQRLHKAICSIHQDENDQISEDFMALDALCVHASALDVLALESRHVLWLMDACYDAADRQAMDALLPGGGIVTSAIEEQVRISVPIKREQNWQHSLVESLAKASSLSEVERISAMFLNR